MVDNSIVVAENIADGRARFIEAMARRQPLVICDNTNTEHWEYSAYAAAAKALGYRTPLDIYRQTDSSGSEPPDDKRIEIARKKMIAG